MLLKATVLTVKLLECFVLMTVVVPILALFAFLAYVFSPRTLITNDLSVEHNDFIVYKDGDKAA